MRRVVYVTLVCAAGAAATAQGDQIEFAFADSLPGTMTPTTLDFDSGAWTFQFGPDGVGTGDVVDPLGDADNQGYLVSAIAPGERVISLSWELTGVAPSPSVLSDLRIAILGEGLEGISLNAFDGLNFDGQSTSASSGTVDLEALGLDFELGASGDMHIVLYSAFDSVQGADGTITAGSISIGITPTPGTIAMLGLAGTLAARRRRNG